MSEAGSDWSCASRRRAAHAHTRSIAGPTDYVSSMCEQHPKTRQGQGSRDLMCSPSRLFWCAFGCCRGPWQRWHSSGRGFDSLRLDLPFPTVSTRSPQPRAATIVQRQRARRRDPSAGGRFPSSTAVTVKGTSAKPTYWPLRSIAAAARSVTMTSSRCREDQPADGTLVHSTAAGALPRERDSIAGSFATSKGTHAGR